MSWLWFLLALFIDSIINYPLLKWTQRRYSDKPITLKDDGLVVAAFFIIMILWGIISVIVGGKDGLGIDYLAPLTALLAFNFLVFALAPVAIKKYGGENWYKYTLIIQLIGPIACILMNQINAKSTATLYGFVRMINYDLIFMAQGLVNQTYSKEMTKIKNELSETVCVIWCFWWFLVIYSISAPTSSNNTGYVFYYPLYLDTSL